MPADSEIRHSPLFETEVRKKKSVYTSDAMKVAIPGSLLCGATGYSLTYVYSRCSARATIYSTVLGFTTFLGTIMYYHKYRNVKV
ncbi:hypothetical protein ACF0H5_021597 [Mactra antiquata]